MAYKQEDCPISALKLSDIDVGYKAELTHTITQDDLNTFASLVGDFNPIHVDPEFARTTSFGKPIVHGMLTSSFISTMVGMLLPGRGALWTEQTLRFMRPTFVGDAITVTAEVVQISPATQTIISKVKITNQNDVTVVSGESTVQLTEGVTSAEAMSKAERSGSAEVASPVGTASEAQGGHVILVTGGSGGIGAACAKELARAGFLVAVNYHTNQEAADGVVSAIDLAGGRAIAVRGDVSDGAQVAAMFEEIEGNLGGVAGLVHCAASEPVPTAFDETGWQAFDGAFQVQVGGAHHCVTRALPNMVAQKLGSIVLVGSIYGDGKPPVQQSAYVTAKAALAGFARALATELGPKGVRVNVVAPGMTQTTMTANLPQKAKMLTKMNTPLRRLADPDDVAAAVTFLISDAARHITGETLHVSGGA